MLFWPFVCDSANQETPVSIRRMTRQDAVATDPSLVWQTSWTSEYLQDDRFEKYAAKVNEKLIALGAYEILENALIVHLAYWKPIRPQIQPLMAEIRNIGVSGG